MPCPKRQHEKKERTILGIVFAGGEGPEPDSLRCLFASLESKALTAAADSGLHLAEAAGLQPDLIVGDMDSLDNEARLAKYPSENIIRYPSDKDYSDTELAFSLLQEKGCSDIWIVGGGGGRIDHLFGIRDMFERHDFPCRWITANEDTRCVVEGRSLVVDTEPGNLVSVFLLGEGPWKAQSQGLKWPLDDVCWVRGTYGLSNRSLVEKITITAVQGRFLVVLLGKSTS